MKRDLSALRDPESCARALWERVPHYIRLTFCSAVVLGLATHMYMFTNKFTNHDDLGALFGTTYGAGSGRWLCPMIIHLSGSFSMPWLIGVLSILSLAAAACFSVSLLRIRRPLGCILSAALMVSFPVVLSTFTFTFTAFPYCLSLALAAFGAWAAVRGKWWGSGAAAVSIALSLSIYQSYFPAAAALMVGALLFDTLDGERDFKALFLRGLRLLGTLAAALVLYMISVRVTTHGDLVDYMGLQTMGQIKLSELPGQIQTAYLKYFQFFWQDEAEIHFRGLPYALLLAALGAVALTVLVLRRRRMDPARTALAAALLVIYPLAADLIYVMVPEAPVVHTLMIYGLCYVLLLPIALAEYAGPVLQEGPGRIFHGAVSWAVLLTMALCAHSYIVVDNRTYLEMDLTMRQCEAYSTRLLARIEACEGYYSGISTVLVGSNVEDPELFPSPGMGFSRLTGVRHLYQMRTGYTYSYFLRDFLGYPWPVYLGDSDVGLAMTRLDEVQDMPAYPMAGSVKVINGMVVVRLT